MEVGLMRRQWIQYIEGLIHEGTLDGQYLQLLQLQDESNPTFVSEVVTLFFEDTEELLNKLRIAISQPPVDFKKIDDHVHQLKGSSSRYKFSSLAMNGYARRERPKSFGF
uniref:Histidine-containing phosphotransfer protein n=1 Tax=Cucumis melo TaxID=3656 RepID=A0A9I9CPL5_CUCME